MEDVDILVVVDVAIIGDDPSFLAVVVNMVASVVGGNLPGIVGMIGKMPPTPSPSSGSLHRRLGGSPLKVLIRSRPRCDTVGG